MRPHAVALARRLKQLFQVRLDVDDVGAVDDVETQSAAPLKRAWSHFATPVFSPSEARTRLLPASVMIDTFTRVA
jgi:hypothetical protein